MEKEKIERERVLEREFERNEDIKKGTKIKQNIQRQKQRGSDKQILVERKTHRECLIEREKSKARISFKDYTFHPWRRV